MICNNSSSTSSYSIQLEDLNPLDVYQYHIMGIDTSNRYKAIGSGFVHQATSAIIRHRTAPFVDQIICTKLNRDTDGDGLADWLETEVYGSQTNAIDSDSDGTSDRDEAIAGTILTNAASRFSITDFTPHTIHWSSASNRSYAIWGCTNLQSNIWIKVDVPIISEGFNSSATLSKPETQQHFFRVSVE